MTANSVLTRASMLLVFVPVGLHALYWLWAGHPEASQARHAAVWVQAAIGFGISGWMLFGRIHEDGTRPHGK